MFTHRITPPILIVAADGENPGVDVPTMFTTTESTVDVAVTVTLLPNITAGCTPQR